MGDPPRPLRIRFRFGFDLSDHATRADHRTVEQTESARERIRCEAATRRFTRCRRRAVVWRMASGTVLACCSQHDAEGYALTVPCLIF